MNKFVITDRDFNKFNEETEQNNLLILGINTILNKLSPKLRQEALEKGFELTDGFVQPYTVIEYSVPQASQKLSEKLKFLSKKIVFIKA